MGSEKYPDENDFDVYVKKHGGGSNAYTDCERVSFHILLIISCVVKFLHNLRNQKHCV